MFRGLPDAGPVPVTGPAGMPVLPGRIVRVRLDLSYDGTDFAGWAVQPGQRTVAGLLSEALSTLFRAPVPMVVAGRTDAGVHATGQVAHIDVAGAALDALAPRDLRRSAVPGTTPVEGPGPRPSSGPAAVAPDASSGLVGMVRRLAGLLPADVRIWRATVAPVGFDARFSALRRHYTYRISTARWGVEPLRRFDTLHWGRPLDVEAMRRAALRLLGLHDFAAYCRPREGSTTIRDLQRTEVVVDGDLVRIEVVADAFCHSMVRSLVGALLAVGSGRFPDDRPAALLLAGRRTAEIPVVAAHGLTLTGVDYPPDAELASRASLTRAVRAATAADSHPGARN
jgi:tRNA pseudouridine38-40 synthase